MTNEVKNVPELRFPEYSEEWEKKRLKDISKINPKLMNEFPSEFDYIDLESVYKGKINKVSRVTNENAPSRAQRVAQRGDVFFQTVRPYQQNNFVFLDDRYSTVVSTGYAQIRSNMNSFYIYNLLLTSTFLNKVLINCTGSNYPAINSNDLGNISIRISTNENEKQKIGEFFSKLDQQIELEVQKLSLLEEQKKGYMQQIFSQQLRFKDENGDYYSEWKEKLIKDILEFENNRRKPITSSLREIGKYPYYGATGIIDYVKDYIFDGETRLLIGEDGAKWGAFEESSFIAKNRYWVNNHAHVCKSKINNLVFLNYLLNYKELRTYVTGNAPAKLTYNNLSMIPMFLPSVYEQEKIGNFLKKIDELIGKQNKKINELKIRKQGFLQKMFI